MSQRRVRVAAYGVCVRKEQVLLARFTVPSGRNPYWTLPGGGLDHGEDPSEGVVREVFEETGYRVEVEALLGVDSRVRPVGRGGEKLSMHNIGVFYRVRITGGELTAELDGSTDLAAWIPLADIPELDRAVLVDVGLALERARPADGHVDPFQVGGHLID